MAEPFAAAVFAEEQKPVPFEIDSTSYKPAWALGHVVQGSQDIANAQAQNTGFIDTLKRAGRSGDNFAVQIARDIERIHSSGPEDPAWQEQKKDWIEQRRKRIGIDQDWRYNQTNNREEAEEMLSDQETNAREQDMLARRAGVSTFVARGLAGAIDVDAPLTVFSGGLTAGAKAGIFATKIGRVAVGVGLGATTAGLAASAAYSADPNSDWTVIPVSGLMGAIFGGAGSAIHARAGSPRSPIDAANSARDATLNEFGETITEGMPRAKEDPRFETFENVDPYGSAQMQRDLQAAAEADIAAEKAASTPTVSGAVKEKPKPTAIDIENAASETGVQAQPLEGRSSIGARQLGNTGPGVASIRNARLQKIVQDAKTWAAQSGIPVEWTDGWGNLQGTAKQSIGRAAERFHNAVNSTPLASDFAKMMNSGSAVAQRFAYDMMENASGIIRNARSGARLMDHYQKGMLDSFQHYDDAYANWSGSVHGIGPVRRQWDANIRREFDRAVTAEMQSRHYDGHGIHNQHPDIKRAADALDDTFRKEVEITQGRPNEMGVVGSQNLSVTSGYMPQKWLGRNMLTMINTGQATRQQIVDAVAEGYTSMHPQMKMTDAKIYADAVVGRAEKFDEGINTNLIGMLAADGRTELADLLTRQGNMSAHDIERFIDRLTGAMEIKSSPGHTKARLDIDMRFTASNGIKIMDLMDTDFASMVPRRVRRSAGQAALARKGLPSKADWDAMVDAILEEQKANGKSAQTGTSVSEKLEDYIDSDKHLTKEYFDNLYTYFSGDPVAGGISPIYSRMKKLTNLALLNQLGLTQLAEFGVTIASVGVQQFFRHAGEAIRGELKNIDSPLVQELKHMSIFVPEEKLFRDDLVHEFEKHTSTSELGRNLDRLLNKAQRIQGYTSGFYKMRTIQQRIAVTSAADKLARHFRDGGLISDARLADMGLNRPEIASLQKYVQNGTVQFDPQGNLKTLGLRNWAPEDAELFALTLNASTNTLVQKAMIGESSLLFHKDGVASLFWHLKSFPMLAMEKQLLRQTRIMDTEAAMTFMYGLGTAAAAYTARQVINGRTENLTFEKISKGAFGYSNMTGWIPMWTDPLAGMLGIDSLKVGGYGGFGGNQVISTPAALGTLDRMVQAPAAAVHSVLNLGPSTADINALTATPLIGNAYGFAFMFNALRD